MARPSPACSSKLMSRRTGSAQLRTEIDSRSTARNLFGRGRDADGGACCSRTPSAALSRAWHWRATARLRQCAAAISNGASARERMIEAANIAPAAILPSMTRKAPVPRIPDCSAGRTALTAALSALARRAASVCACRCRRLSLVQRRCNPLSSAMGATTAAPRAELANDHRARAVRTACAPRARSLRSAASVSPSRRPAAPVAKTPSRGCSRQIAPR